MTLEQTAVPARSDVRPAATAIAGPSTRTARPFRRHGNVITVGALAWAGSQVVTGANPDHDDLLHTVLFGAGSLAFQIGLLHLVRVLWRTRALGDGGLARAVLRLEAVLITFAIGSTLSDTVGLTDFDQLRYLLLDLCWPLSMLGMFFIGIRIAVAGRWHGASRYWPMVAESWAVVVIPTMGIFGATAAGVVSVVHLCIGYAVLGQLVARKER